MMMMMMMIIIIIIITIVTIVVTIISVFVSVIAHASYPIWDHHCSASRLRRHRFTWKSGGSVAVTCRGAAGNSQLSQNWWTNGWVFGWKPSDGWNCWAQIFLTWPFLTHMIFLAIWFGLAGHGHPMEVWKGRSPPPFRVNLPGFPGPISSSKAWLWSSYEPGGKFRCLMSLMLI